MRMFRSLRLSLREKLTDILTISIAFFSPADLVARDDIEEFMRISEAPLRH